MSRISLIAVGVLALSLWVGLTESRSTAVQEGPRKGPELGFDWRALINEHQALIKAGEAEKAVEFIFTKGKYGKVSNLAVAEDFKKKFSLVYATGGNHEGLEIFGYKQIGPNAVLFYVLSHYEHLLLQYTYGFERWKGEWKFQNFGISDKMEDFARDLPIERIAVN